MDIVSYILSKKYTDQTVDGLGAIKGAPCTVQSIVDITDGKRVTLAWEGNSGVEQTQSFDIMNGEDGANTIEWSQIQQSGTKIAEININGVSTNIYAPTGGGGGSANITELTQDEYDLLPSSKLSDDVLYMAYNDGTSLDPDYTYVKYGTNDEIIVRIYHQGQADQETLWFFNGWNQTTLDVAIPEELQAYKPNSTDPIFSDNYATVGGTQTSWFGFYNNNFRSWDLSLGGQYIGIIHAVVNPFPSETGQQTNGYYSPYVYIQNTEPTRKIYLNEHEYSDFNNKVKVVTQSEYNALPSSKLTDGKIYCISDSVGGVDGYPPLIYSDQEREVGVWRDGKPLYQKTIYLGALTQDSNWHNISHGISNMDKCVKFDSVIIATNGTEFYPIPLYRPTTQSGVILYADATDIYYMNNYYDQMDGTYVTIQYTKTTDTPGSGTWTTYGSYAHHYSTDEHVIGTWIDGKPIYEITSRITQDLSLTANTWVKLQFDQGTKKALYKTMIVNDDGAVIDNVAGGFVDDKIAINSPRTLTVLANTGYLIMQYTKTTD